MYMLYIDNVLFPVAPGKIVTETQTDNRMYSLVDGSYVTGGGGRMLKKISFELLLPMRRYPFAYYEANYCDGEYYVDKLNLMVEKNVPVDFDLYRNYKGSDSVYLTSMKVVVEKIEVIEDAEKSPDIVVRVVLREYRSVDTKIAAEKTRVQVERESSFTVPETYTVKTGDSLWLISKKFFDDGSKYKYLAEINGIKSPYHIYAGTKIKLRE